MADAKIAIADILRNCTFSVDGRGYAGRAEKVTLPKLTVNTEDYRAGGMDMPVQIDMGLEPLTATIVSRAIDADLLRSWGVATGERAQITVRGALVSEAGQATAVVCHLRGQITECDWGEWKPGEAVSLTLMMAVRYYRLDHGGQTVHEIDAERMIRIVNGTDQLAEQRAALGIGP